ncbi:hypothetical protein [Spirilliplanes yamanashiensis]|uniref:Uncharacterized protein n=1 Tax=Spirilliplanes yamanashiensis TaxID=42233 RepID=A0A8J3YES1_9ACTN|nr:hypothetical protein [Spirilliplanes yamanashiensis]MDP9818219.1 hypothetical protein [Spirilliplanes yamanashiensis]GIJ06754.1 hypothetical protein Sya03_61060 [Spirilliplanes yamanashiensis]
MAIRHPGVPGTRRTALGTALAALEAVVGLSAVYGGVMLIADAWHLPVADLRPLPLHSWVLPGVALLLAVALPMGAAAAGLWLARPWGPRASVGAGAVLTAWVAGQVAVIGPQMILQAVLLVVGLVVMVLGARLSRAHRPVVAAHR